MHATMLADIWFGLLSLFLFLYVVLDGFDLGVGILSLMVDEEKQSIMMASLASTWNANETWLVLLGGGMFGAMPLAYAVVLHALYIPIILMVFGLIFRAVAFEFREHAREKRVWNLAFGLGSLFAAMAQGLVLGGVLSGINVRNDAFAGGPWDWLNPFSILAAAGVIAGYTLLGANYLILKTDGAVQEWNFRQAYRAGFATIAAGVAVTVTTPFVFPYVAEKWFSIPGIFLFGSLSVLMLASFFMMLRALSRRRELAPIICCVGMFTAPFIGLLISLHPYVLPPSVTVYHASAAPATLVFMLAGIGFLIPIMLFYNAYQYLAFRGKIRPGGYGE